MNAPVNVELRGKLAGIELGPKMQALNERERIFAFAYGSGIAKSAAEAARLAGFGKPHTQSAYAIGHRPRVIEAIEEVARTNFRQLVPRVIRAAEKVIDDPKQKGHVPMIISLLSKLGYGEKASVDINVTGEVVVSHQEAAVDDLARLKSLGLSREKLVEVFGFSGLDRYEAMLAARPKVIEHIPNEVASGSPVPPAPNGAPAIPETEPAE